MNVPRSEGSSQNTAAENSVNLASVEEYLDMETEEMGEEFNAEIIAGWNSNSNEFNTVPARETAGIIKGKLSLSKNKDLLHDSVEINSVTSKKNSACAKNKKLPCEFKTLIELSSCLSSDLPRACPNDLFWQQIDEIDKELKKYDTHVSATLGKSHQESTISQLRTPGVGENTIRAGCNMSSITESLWPLIPKNSASTGIESDDVTLVEFLSSQSSSRIGGRRSRVKKNNDAPNLP